MNDVELGTAAGCANWTPMQKLAGFLLILEPDNATEIMKRLEDQELEAVSIEIAKFKTISQQIREELLREFSPVAVAGATAITGGVDRLKSLLEKSVGLFRASNIITRVSPLRAPVAAMQEIVEMEVRHIFNLVRHEQLQTITLVASYLTADKASKLLSLLKPDMREKVVTRLATMTPIAVEVVEDVADMLQMKLASDRSRAVNQTGGIKVAAQILNALPKRVSESILISMKERDFELGTNILKSMFTFEELEELDSASLQKILQKVEMRTLTVSLKTASEGLKNKLLGSLSKRAAVSVREEISFLGPLKFSEIDAAQMEIIEVVKQLEAEGEIDLEEMRAGAQ